MKERPSSVWPRACIAMKGTGMRKTEMPRKRKPIPAFRSEAEERRFWESHDSSPISLGQGPARPLS
jgi:hypothetical protein